MKSEEEIEFEINNEVQNQKQIEQEAIELESKNSVSKISILSGYYQHFKNDMIKEICEITQLIHDIIIDNKIKIQKLNQFHFYYTDHFIKLFDKILMENQEKTQFVTNRIKSVTSKIDNLKKELRINNEEIQNLDNFNKSKERYSDLFREIVLSNLDKYAIEFNSNKESENQLMDKYKKGKLKTRDEYVQVLNFLNVKLNQKLKEDGKEVVDSSSILTDDELITINDRTIFSEESEIAKKFNEIIQQPKEMQSGITTISGYDYPPSGCTIDHFGNINMSSGTTVPMTFSNEIDMIRNEIKYVQDIIAMKTVDIGVFHIEHKLFEYMCGGKVADEEVLQNIINTVKSFKYLGDSVSNPVFNINNTRDENINILVNLSTNMMNLFNGKVSEGYKINLNEINSNIEKISMEIAKFDVELDSLELQKTIQLDNDCLVIIDEYLKKLKCYSDTIKNDDGCHAEKENLKIVLSTDILEI